MKMRKLYNLLSLRVKKEEYKPSLNEAIKYLESIDQNTNIGYSSKNLTDRLHLQGQDSRNVDMKPEEILEELREIAEKRDVKANYQEFSGIFGNSIVRYLDIKAGNLERYIQNNPSLNNFDSENYKGIPEKEIRLSLKS